MFFTVVPLYGNRLDVFTVTCHTVTDRLLLHNDQPGEATST